MNDFISPILKLLSTIVSVRAAVRYVAVGISLVFSWVEIKPLLAPYGLPSEISGTTCTLIGVGIGSISAAILFFFIDSIFTLWKCCKEKKRSKEEAKQAQEEKEEKEAEFINTFISNIMHLDITSRDILKALVKSDKSYTTDPRHANEFQIKAIEGLRSNGRIIKVMNIDSKTNVYCLNPLLREWTSNYFNEMIKSDCNEFIDNLTPSRSKALQLLEDNEFNEPGLAKFPMELVISNYHYLPCIECTASQDYEEPFFFEFREDYREAFEELLNKKYKNYVEAVIAI